MRVIGITGGVGAGKSRILDILKEEFGAHVIQADVVAKELEEPGQPGYKRLLETFGKGILSEDGTIDRTAFAEMIFSDEEAIRQVNAIIHPMVWQTVKEQIAKSHAALVAVEAALFDERSREACEELWFVDTSEENRIRRLFKNRGYSREKSLGIMGNQPPRETFLGLADQVIDNNGTPEEVRRQIRQILKRQES